MLTQHMRPDRSAVEFPAGFNTVEVEHAIAAAHACASWPVVTCEVDGVERVVRYWNYAGGWCGVISERPEVEVLLVGAGFGPRGVRLATVHASASYGFDASARLRLSQLREARRQRPDAALPLPRSSEMHTDHRALIEQHRLG